MKRQLLRPSGALLLVHLLASPTFAGEVEMLLDSQPSGARVEQAGRVLGTTPLRLRYPTGYFESRLTTFGAFLGAPLEFTLSTPGFEPKTVKLGRGPFPWRNLYGQIIYQFYLLDRSYRVELVRASGSTGGEGDVVGQLERLAQLREKGLLTEEEFNSAKARILAGAPAAAVQPRPSNPLDQGSAEEFCGRILDGTIPNSEMAKPLTAERQASSATNGDDRQVLMTCSWGLIVPRPATLTVKVACGDAPQDASALCASVGHAASADNPACVWGSEGAARAASRQGCVMDGSLVVDVRKVSRLDNPIVIDMRDVLRAMASRI